jgi:hypothetical protein
MASVSRQFTAQLKGAHQKTGVFEPGAFEYGITIPRLVF